MRIGKHPLYLDQDGWRENQHVRAGDDGQKKVAGKAMGWNFRIGTNQDVGIKNNPHGRQRRD